MSSVIELIESIELIEFMELNELIELVELIEIGMSKRRAKRKNVYLRIKQFFKKGEFYTELVNDEDR